MSADPTPPALTDAKGMGGVIAQDGFNYQLWDGLVRLPRWLANPAFEELIFEGLEDLEARFFAPQAPRGRLLERFQAKGGDLTPAGVREVLESRQRISEAFEALSALAARSVGTPISRRELLRTIEGGLGQPLPLPARFPLHIRSDRNETDETALEIDASMFSGGAAPFPVPERWAEDLVAPLDRTARWLRASAVSPVALGGSYRLSTAMTLGWALRAASGFELEIPTRDGPWLTDDRPRSEDPAPPWRITEPATLQGDDLVVSIGVLRDPSADLPGTAGVAADRVLSAYLPEPLVSGRAAQASASAVKRTVDGVAARLKPNGIKLFMAGPAAFAVALGHRWNAMPPTQLHEFMISERRYVATARL